MDASRFPQGIDIDGSLLIARPVGGIVHDTITNTMQHSTNAGAAAYSPVGPGANGTAVEQLADPGTGAAIPVDKSYSISFVTGAAGQTNSLAAPSFVGQQMLLALVTDGGGDRVVTVAGAIGFRLNQTGNNTITFNDAGDNVKLLAVYTGTTLTWEIVSNDDCVLSTV